MGHRAKLMHGSVSEVIGKYESKCEMEKFLEVGFFFFIISTVTTCKPV